MRKTQPTAFQRNLSNLRKLLRQRTVLFARSHRGCDVPRGCGCNTDLAISLIEKAERDLFDLEIRSYSSDALNHGGYDRYETEHGKASKEHLATP